MMPPRIIVSRASAATAAAAASRPLKIVSSTSQSLLTRSGPTSTITDSTSSSTLSPPMSSPTRRALSTNGSMALLRLRTALEEYRQREYQREVPSRFKKDIVRAAVASNVRTASKPSNCIRDATVPPRTRDDTSATPYVAMEGLYHVLMNIGAGNKVSKMDLQTLFDEIGVSVGHGDDNSSSSQMIPAQQMIHIL